MIILTIIARKVLRHTHAVESGGCGIGVGTWLAWIATKKQKRETCSTRIAGLCQLLHIAYCFFCSVFL